MKKKGRLPGKKKSKVEKKSSANQQELITIQGSHDPKKKTGLFFASNGEKLSLPAGITVEEYNIHIGDATRMLELSSVAPEQYDVIGSLNHLNSYHAHEVIVIAKEFYRIIKQEGTVTVSVPNLSTISEVIAGGKLEGELYKTQQHPIAPIDLLYGNRRFIAAGRKDVAAKTGFTTTTLANRFISAGFGKIIGDATITPYVIWLNAIKTPMPASGKPIINMKEPDINKMMQERDAIDKPPVIWNNELAF